MRDPEVGDVGHERGLVLRSLGQVAGDDRIEREGGKKPEQRRERDREGVDTEEGWLEIGGGDREGNELQREHDGPSGEDDGEVAGNGTPEVVPRDQRARLHPLRSRQPDTQAA